MSIRVRNADTKAAPNVAVTVETDPSKPGEGTAAFGQRSSDTRLADPERPVWVVDDGPAGGDSRPPTPGPSAASRPARRRSSSWKVTAVEPGTYTIKYRVSPGLNGRARLAAGGRADGSFKVEIARQAGPRPRRRRRQRRPRRRARRLQGASAFATRSRPSS